MYFQVNWTKFRNKNLYIEIEIKISDWNKQVKLLMELDVPPLKQSQLNKADLIHKQKQVNYWLENEQLTVNS